MTIDTNKFPTPPTTCGDKKTLRDEFAMAYLQGLAAYKGFYPLDAATECYKVADYMLAAREKK